jgi:hypothetical protein
MDTFCWRDEWKWLISLSVLQKAELKGIVEKNLFLLFS